MRKKEGKKQIEWMNELPLIPREVCPEPTAVKACSIWTSLPEGLKVVRENEYWLSPMIWFDLMIYLTNNPTITITIKNTCSFTKRRK